MKVIYLNLLNFDYTNKRIDAEIIYENAGTMTYVAPSVDLTGVHSYEDFREAISASMVANAPGGAITESDIGWPSIDPAKAQSASFTNPSRSLNSAFQISTTRNAMAFYSVSIPTNLSLTGGENGAVVLEYADDNGISSNVITVGTVRNGNTGTLTIGLNTLASMGCQVSGMIPAGKYVRLRPVDTTGSPIQAFVNSQEVLI